MGFIKTLNIFKSMIEENSEGEQNDSQELSDSDEEVEFKEMNLKVKNK